MTEPQHPVEADESTRRRARVHDDCDSEEDRGREEPSTPILETPVVSDQCKTKEREGGYCSTDSRLLYPTYTIGRTFDSKHLVKSIVVRNWTTLY